MPRARRLTTNKHRAIAADMAINTHTEIAGDNRDKQSNLVDLVTNLMHLADRERINFSNALDTARRHYMEEI